MKDSYPAPWLVDVSYRSFQGSGPGWSSGTGRHSFVVALVWMLREMWKYRDTFNYASIRYVPRYPLSPITLPDGRTVDSDKFRKALTALLFSVACANPTTAPAVRTLGPGCELGTHVAGAEGFPGYTVWAHYPQCPAPAGAVAFGGYAVRWDK